MAKKWEQLSNESNAAYARFLAYRNLGPGRTLQMAYESHQATLPAKNRNKSERFTGVWRDDSTNHHWRDRATSWDVHNLLTQGERAATLYIASVEVYVEKLYRILTERDIEPDAFDSLTKAIETLAKLFPGESVGALIVANEQRRAERTDDTSD